MNFNYGSKVDASLQVGFFLQNNGIMNTYLFSPRKKHLVALDEKSHKDAATNKCGSALYVKVI